MTEDEAKTKWCPNVNIAAAHQDHFPSEVFTSRGNVGEEGPNTTNCLGSECMAWRDGGTRIDNVGVPHEDRPRRVSVGYCGLVGKP